VKYLRDALTTALASAALLGGSGAWAQERPADELERYEELILKEGNGWQQKTIQGTVFDDATKQYKDYSTNVYSLQKEGISEVPMPSDIREELSLDAESGEPTVYTLSQQILEEIEISRRQGKLTPALEALAQQDGEDPSPDQPRREGDFEAPRAKKGFSCSDQVHTRSKSLNINAPLNYSTNLGSGFSGSLSATGNLSGSATGEVEFTIKRKKVLWACIPYGAKFNKARAYGNAAVNYGANLSGTLSYNYSWQTQVAKPHLGALTFMIGPVPVYIGFNLPINVGLDVTASVTGSVTYVGSQAATGSFDYTCSLSSCSGSSSYNLSNNNQQSLTGSVSGRVQPNIWVQVAVRAYLYTEWVAYAQVGIRPYLRGDLWGYYGNACGDADQNGTTETVDALTFDLDWQLYITGQASAFGSSPTQWNNLWSTPRYHIRFWDLIGSDAIEPMIDGPANVIVNAAQAYGGKMRPCWPYTDNVNYQFNWGDASTTNFSGAAQSWNNQNHTWTTLGAKTLSLTALSDSHGRQFNQTSSRTINVVAPVWTPWLNRDAPGGFGDFETLADFIAAGQACATPFAVECKTLGGVDWSQTGDVYSCTASGGGICLNASQPDGSCEDYQVRFLCP
jgi:hypothetical protein